jgi:hypothetical protein
VRLEARSGRTRIAGAGAVVEQDADWRLALVARQRVLERRHVGEALGLEREVDVAVPDLVVQHADDDRRDAERRGTRCPT